MKHSKHGISGLVIVVLLVAIAVALTAMFVGWISSMTGQQMDSMKTSANKLEVCRKIMFDLMKVEVIQNIDENHPPIVRLTVQNRGTPFDGFRARFIGKNTETGWIDAYFKNGKLGGGLQKDTIEWNLSQYVTGPDDNVTYSEIVSMVYVPLVKVTYPVRDTLKCDDMQYTEDLSQYITP